VTKHRISAQRREHQPRGSAKLISTTRIHAMTDILQHQESSGLFALGMDHTVRFSQGSM